MELNWTKKAGVVLLLAISALLLGLVTESRVLLFLALSGGIMLASTRLWGANRLGAIRRRVPAQTVAEEESLPVQVRLDGPRRGSLFLEAEDRVPAVSRLEAGSNYGFLVMTRGKPALLNYDLATQRLGKYSLGPLRLRAQDPFGLMTGTWTTPLAFEYRVHPRIESLKRTPERSDRPQILLGRHEVSQPGEGIDFFGLRDYAPGDRMRSVNWKASARSPTLIVNQYERESRADIVLLVDARALADTGLETDTAYAQSARAAASMALRYLKARDRVRLLTYGEGVAEAGIPGTSLRAGEIFDYLADVQPRGDTPCLQAIESMLVSLRSRSPIVIFSSLIGDPSVEEAVATLRSRNMHVSVVVPKPVPPEAAGEVWNLHLLERRLAMDAIQALGAAVAEVTAGEPISPRLQAVA